MGSKVGKGDRIEMACVAGLKYIHRFFEALPLRRWSLITLPLRVGWTPRFVSDIEEQVGVMVCDLGDKVMKRPYGSSLLFLWDTHSGGSQTYVVKTLRQPCGDTHVTGTEASSQ